MKLSLNNIEVRLVSNENQLYEVLKLRWEAYKKYFPDQEKFNYSFWQEHYDLVPNSKLFLARKNGIPCGSTRLQISNGLDIEIDNHINTKEILVNKKTQYAQSSRLSIPGRFSPSIIMLAILKTLFLFCLKNNVRTIFCNTKQENGALYKKLLFTDIGEAGTFIHPWHKKLNKTYRLDIKRAPKLFSDFEHPLYEFFFEADHSSSLFLN